MEKQGIRRSCRRSRSSRREEKQEQNRVGTEKEERQGE